MELNFAALQENLAKMYSNQVRSSICFSDYKGFHDWNWREGHIEHSQKIE